MILDETGPIDLEAKARDIIARYPEGRERSALVPLLHVAQARDGYVSAQAISEIAGLLHLSSADVRSVASFYSMFHLAPKGKRVVSVCHNIACSLMGAERIISALEKHLEVEAGSITRDGRITLERVECLAFCDKAPMLQVDYRATHGPLDEGSAIAIVEGLRQETSPQRKAAEEKRSAMDADARWPGPSPTEETAESDRVERSVSQGVDIGSSPQQVAGMAAVKLPPGELSSGAGDEPPPLIDSIPLTADERELLEGEHHHGMLPERKLERLPDREIGPGPEQPDSREDPPVRPRGAD